MKEEICLEAIIARQSRKLKKFWWKRDNFEDKMISMINKLKGLNDSL